MERLLNAMNDFLIGEFGDDYEMTMDEMHGAIGLACTTYEFDDECIYFHEIQVDFNVDKMQYENYIDGELVLTEPRGDWKIEEVADEIANCSFEDMIRSCVHKGVDLEENGYWEEAKANGEVPMYP